MKKSLFLFIFSVALNFAVPKSFAADIPFHLIEARKLLETALPETIPLFKETDILIVDKNNDALAKYIPSLSGTHKPAIQFRKNIKPYHDDYVVTSSIIDRAHRPNFDQYMVVLTALSLTNEWAHFKQHKNGSLNDLYRLRDERNTAASCALYDLQQFVSDIVMLESAYQIDAYFRKHNDLMGSLSIQMALEKMWLDQIFWDYVIARTMDQHENIAVLFNEMHRTRYKVNMTGLKNCSPEPQSYKLGNAIYVRAIAPVPSTLRDFIQLDPRP